MVQNKKQLRAMFAKVKGKKSIVQSVIFDKDKWSEDRAKNWLRSHDLKTSKVDVKPSTLRFRQHPPDFCKKNGHGQKEIGNTGSGINFLFCRPKKSI